MLRNNYQGAGCCISYLLNVAKYSSLVTVFIISISFSYSDTGKFVKVDLPQYFKAAKS